jgi:hypothetical protein
LESYIKNDLHRNIFYKNINLQQQLVGVGAYLHTHGKET